MELLFHERGSFVGSPAFLGYFFGVGRGRRLILIFKAPTPKQAYLADFLAFQQRTFCGICLFFFTYPILGRKIPFFHVCSPVLAAKLSFDQIFLQISRFHGKETDDIYLYSGQLHTA